MYKHNVYIFNEKPTKIKNVQMVHQKLESLEKGNS